MLNAQCKIWTVNSTTTEKDKSIVVIDENKMFTTFPDGAKNKPIFIIEGTDIWSTFPEGNKKELKYQLKGSVIFSNGKAKYYIEGRKIFDTYIDGEKAGQLYEIKGNIIYSTYTDGEIKAAKYMFESECREISLILIAIENQLINKIRL